MIAPPYDYPNRPAAFLEAVYDPVAHPWNRLTHVHTALRDEFNIDVQTNEVVYDAFFGTGPTEKYRELVRLANVSKTQPNLAFLRALAAFWTLAVLTENDLALPIGNA